MSWKVIAPVLALAFAGVAGDAMAATTKSGLPLAREVRAQCRDEVKAQGLAGAQAKAARDACFARQRPDLAAKSACRREAKAKGLAKAEASAFVKTCARTPAKAG